MFLILKIQSLRQRLDRADADLVHSRRENLRLSEQISNLEKEVKSNKNNNQSNKNTMTNQLNHVLSLYSMSSD